MKSVTWIHQPDGWPREKHLKGGGTRRMRGKVKCSHHEYITNRAGRILKDPDTGYLAETNCREVARWEKQTIKQMPVFGAYRLIERFCDRHAAAEKARVKVKAGR